jgi:NAD(P)H-hydrate epimerase
MADQRFLYDSKALRAVEAQMEHASGDDFELMRRAGQAAWRELLACWPDAQRVIVVCGPGNNGGDGYVLAWHAQVSGREVRVVRLPLHAPRTDNARHAEIEYRKKGGQVEDFSGHLPPADLVVDALFGIGLSAAPETGAAELIEAINHAGAPVFSLDVPSGVDADRGCVPGAAVHATRTLQFLGGHSGLATGAALDQVGERSLATLGVAQYVLSAAGVHARLRSRDELAEVFSARRRDTHKGQSGHLLCIGGDHGSGGAIALCAEAALRAGAGLVSVATRDVHVAAMLARRPELMARGVDKPRALEALIARADVIALGPGLGQDAWGVALHDAALASGKPLVLDADALNLLAQHPRALPPGTILTPHPGEAARLLNSSGAAVQADRFAAAQALCTAHGCVVVLKGAGTIIASPNTPPHVVAAGNPGMAVGGMGDVLTGVIAALRAQGLSAHLAATHGALLHAVAGDDAAVDGGERGLLPSDLFAHLRRLVNASAMGQARAVPATP